MSTSHNYMKLKIIYECGFVPFLIIVCKPVLYWETMRRNAEFQ